MAVYRGERAAFGAPGIPPKWTHGDKDGVGTAYSADSRLWFTLWNGIVTELYYPTIDRPQLRDLQLLVTDGASFLHEEKRLPNPRAERLSGYSLGYATHVDEPGGLYSIRKEVITNPHLPCLLERVRFVRRRPPRPPGELRAFVLCAPHLEVGGWGNNAYVASVSGRPILLAEKNGIWLALGASVPFTRLSVGYVGASDGWTDLAENFRLDWEFDRAENGNVALTGEIPLERRTTEFTIGLAFGRGQPNAIAALLQSLGRRYPDARRRFVQQWERPSVHLRPLARSAGDGGRLFRSSVGLMLAHEDKTFSGAFIASLSIPWGVAKGDEDRGGYHLVWVRDLVRTATALLAAGNRDAPLRALIYLATCQQPDGGFPQNFWLTGTPYWMGIQLDEVAFPILLAWRLERDEALEDFDPYPMIRAAARYLIEHGPQTKQDRWEEAEGYSPSTLAVCIAALLCAATFARGRHDEPTATFLEEYADFLESHVERWTVTTEGTLVPGIARHYVRIHPASVDDPRPCEDPNHGQLELANQPPGGPGAFPAKEIVDAGFLELVRYGIRSPTDPIVLDSLKVVDAVLKVETPQGPAWHRYNHDGYGERPDGTPYDGWGVGRAWPLLTGERGHFALRAGEDPKPYLEALERFASATGLLPEQIWDEANRPDAHLRLGEPTGSAMPLMWTHAEYVSLLRSAHDGAVFDLIPPVVERYGRPNRSRAPVDIWKPNHRAERIPAGTRLRVIGPAPFVLRWSGDGWKTIREETAAGTALGLSYVDLDGTRPPPSGGFDFTFFWSAENRWEGRDYRVAVE